MDTKSGQEYDRLAKD